MLPYYANGLLTVDSENIEPIFPGVRGKLDKELECYDSTNQKITLPKNAKVIIQPLNKHRPSETPKYILTAFEDDKSGLNADLPESERDIKIIGTYTTEIQNPEKYFTFEEQYELNHAARFPSETSPSIEEKME